MGNEGLFEVALGSSAIPLLRRRIEEGAFLRLDGVSSPARPFLAGILAKLFPVRPILVVTDGLKSQEQFAHDFSAYAKIGGLPEPLFFPAWENLPHDASLPNVQTVSDRLQVLKAIAPPTPNPFIPRYNCKELSTNSISRIVTSIQAMMQKTIAAIHLRERTLSLGRAGELSFDDLLARLVALGFQRVPKVEQKGEFAVRGGIVDMFPLETDQPLRIELLGNRIESFRWFDPVTQVSFRENDDSLRDTIEISAVNEWSFTRSNPDLAVSFPSLLPRGTIVLLDDLSRIEDAAQLFEEQWNEGAPSWISGKDFFDSTRAIPDGRVISMSDEISSPVAAGKGQHECSLCSLQISSLEGFRACGEGMIAEAQRRQFFNQMAAWRSEGWAEFVFCNNDGERRRFMEVVSDLGLKDFKPHVAIAPISAGFIFPDAKVVVVSDAEVFGRSKQVRPRRLRSATVAGVTRRIADYSELTEGDYVVHLQHGIGKYLGLIVLEVGVERMRQEVLAIEYRQMDGDTSPPKLYVPVDQAHLVSKYVGFGKATPELDRLGSSRWSRRKADAERAVRDLAGGLLEIQAARAALKGHAFAPDTSWQREMEASFIYEETPDQVTAIEETKTDMESSRPMDRLLCGDVGYGKTEVAIRAAFKAVMDDKQVAVLVPTTILAQQHWNTFRERMSAYPVKIEMLSRFRTKSEQKKVIGELREGAVDVVIGTHRLLQADIAFKNLGLVVIDEEQRFGVLHKEKFKQFRKLVDVLTLTATPIPRTLYLSLTGARDMSTIETPPHDRLPVQTIVCGYDERVIRDAIRRELTRQGQIYFLHNRVQSIEKMRDRIVDLVPEARVEIGHGQMHEDELEEVMKRFINGDVDVLLCTTIVESGLDIPNANTIIIDRADRFGLSDLYQLRGRVGRYKHQAFAYLLLPRHARLLDTARKRITAIKQYAHLGAGFKVAMRDLEIRGAGNILGAEQSGHIAAIGFELYCQLLKESVARLKGEAVKPRPVVEMKLDFIAFASASVADGQTPAQIPFAYIGDSKQRIEIYRKIAQCVDLSDVDRLRREIRDRFGPLQPPVKLLLDVAALKICCGTLGVSVLETSGDKIMIQRGGDYIMVDGRFPRLTAKRATSRVAEIRKLVTVL